MLTAFANRLTGAASRIAFDKRGAAAIEYAVLMSVIVLGIIGGMQATGTSVEDVFSGVFQEVSEVFAAGS